MRAGRTIAAVMVLISTGLTLGPATPANALSPRPSYLDPYVEQFAVFGNSHWVVGGMHASQFGGTPAPSTQGYDIAGNEKPKYMWAQTCTVGKQRLTFHRTIWLPGQPQSLQLYASPTRIASWSTPFTSIDLIVNDKLIVHSHASSLHDELQGSSLPTVFRPGKNAIVFAVVKSANPSSVKSCGAHSATRLGIQMALVGQDFPVDLAVTPVPSDQKTKWVHVKPGDPWTFLYYLHITNKGPTDSGAGKFGFLVQPGFMTWATPVGANPQDPFACSSTAVNRIDCTYDDWFTAGKTVTLTLYGKVTAPTDESNDEVAQMFIDWNVGVQTDRNDQVDTSSTNDSTGLTVYFCYPAATTYGCDTH